MSSHIVLARVKELAAARARGPLLLMPRVNVAAEIACLRERFSTVLAPMFPRVTSDVLSRTRSAS